MVLRVGTDLERERSPAVKRGSIGNRRHRVDGARSGEHVTTTMETVIRSTPRDAEDGVGAFGERRRKARHATDPPGSDPDHRSARSQSGTHPRRARTCY